MIEDPFITHRALLFTVAYEMLGSAADAEDAVQETWLRWAGVDQSEVQDPRAYLVRIVTRQALNRLRTLSRRRETYVGEWLPEPLLTTPNVSEDIELAESVSIAMLVVLETLTPIERAVFVLREVFDTPYEEIATTVDKSPVAVRQIAHRARQHVAMRRPRMQVDNATQRQVLERFVEAARTGEVDALLEVLAPDVVMIADGGGVAVAFRQPIHGATKVAALLAGFGRQLGTLTATTISINGAPALVLQVPGEADTVLTVAIDAGRVTRIYAIRNPHKLSRISDETALTR